MVTRKNEASLEPTLMRSIDRSNIVELEDLPNVGKSIAADLRQLGIRAPAQLKRKDPYALYARLNRLTGTRHDPCLLDTFIAAVRFVEGGPAQPWWAFTAERKRELAARSTRNRNAGSPRSQVPSHSR
jgi:Pathogenicity locus